MEKPSVKCALLATMIAKHKWGMPITEEALLDLSAIDGDYPTAREVYDDLRTEAYIPYRGNRGIELDQSNFEQLADVLYYECGWESWEIESRFKHYEPRDVAGGSRSTVWRHDADRGVFILADSDGHEHATFGSHDAIFRGAEPYPATESDIEDEEEWKRVKRPIIPERVFDGDPPSSDAWDVIVVRAGPPTRRTSCSTMGRRPPHSRRSRPAKGIVQKMANMTL